MHVMLTTLHLGKTRRAFSDDAITRAQRGWIHKKLHITAHIGLHPGAHSNNACSTLLIPRLSSRPTSIFCMWESVNRSKRCNHDWPLVSKGTVVGLRIWVVPPGNICPLHEHTLAGNPACIGGERPLHWWRTLQHKEGPRWRNQ